MQAAIAKTDKIINLQDDFSNPEYLYQHAPCGLISFAANGDIVQVNNTFCQWLGFSKNELLYGQKFDALLSIGNKFYFQMVVNPMLAMQGHAEELSMEFNCANGKSLHCLLNAAATRNADGTIAYTHATIVKITDRKKYEALLLNRKEQAEAEKMRLDLLSNNIPAIIWTAQPSGKVDFLNTRFYEFFNYPQGNVSNLSLLRLVEPCERRKLFAAWKHALQSREEMHLETRLLTANGCYEWHAIKCISYTLVEDEKVVWIGTCTNVHKQKELERELLETLYSNLQLSEKSLDKKNEQLRQIAFEQSHLVRSPLSNVLGIAHLLKKDISHTEQIMLLEMLEKSARQLDDIIRKIVNKTQENLI